MTNYQRFKKLKYIVQGINTYLDLDFLPRHMPQFTENSVRKENDSRDLARSCYTVWMRSWVSASVISPIKGVAEIGPGDCLGVGICGLLSGAERYYPIDRFPRSRNCDNLFILEELIKLFEEKASIPDDEEFPKASPSLPSWEFPNNITPALDRIDSIRKLIKLVQDGQPHAEVDGLIINYSNPHGVDFVVSNAALEHVDDPKTIYKNMYSYMNPGGRFAHAIDLKCHWTGPLWNTHWTYSDLIWRIIQGRAKYLINRWPHSWHTNYLKNLGFKILRDEAYKDNNQLSRKDLAKKFKNLTEKDLETTLMFIAGVKI